MPGKSESQAVQNTHARASALAHISNDVIECRRCPRLVVWREQCAESPRASYGQEVYWGRALPGFGDPNATVMIVGLAPAAHGANRTGRMFTGDRSGDFLFAALHRVGFANQATSEHREDGLWLTDAYVTGAVRCAPPDNKPTPVERDTCARYLASELEALDSVRVVVALGAFAFDAITRIFERNGRLERRRALRFSHGAHYPIGRETEHDLTVLCSYHPSQRNVFTGLLTAEAFDEVLIQARELSVATD